MNGYLRKVSNIKMYPAVRVTPLSLTEKFRDRPNIVVSQPDWQKWCNGQY